MDRAAVLLSRLDPEQREVAQATRGPVCVLAGAGTGKTRAITYRIAYAVLTGVTAPQRVLAVTFTTRAAGGLRARLRELGAPGVPARTFHSAAYKQLAYFWPKVVGGEPPRLIESKFALVAEAARLCRLSLGQAELRDAAAEVEWAKITQTRPDDYAAAAAKARRSPPAEPDAMARLYGTYESLRRERNLLDFEGMLELTAAIFTEHRDVAREFREQYRFFVVDEYQDVNPLQKLLLDGWLGDSTELCVVGDPNQTIYSFTGASPSYLLDFTIEYPAAKVVRLVRDYRSTPQVVRLAGGVLGADHHLVAQRPAGPEPTFHEYDDEVAEAEGVARRARQLVDAGVPAREIAVLFRVNAQSEAYERSFADAGLPYVVRGAERFFERAEVRQAVVLLRGAARSPGTEPLVRAVRDVLASAGLSERPPEGRGAARERWESLTALVQLAEDVAADRPDAGLKAFVAELEERAAVQHAPALEGVTLATLHAAKGLEWDAVFLTGLVDGMVPISYAESNPEQVEEERRLCYVGVTRAREHLALSWALARSPGGRKGRRRSRFLDGLVPGRAGPPRVERRRAPVKGPQPCRICGRRLIAAIERKLGRCETCPADYDEDLLARMREWRAATAGRLKVPAYVVFTDATLQALAERVPESEAELTAIPGVGAVKLARYGAAVLALCRGETPREGG